MKPFKILLFTLFLASCSQPELYTYDVEAKIKALGYTLSEPAKPTNSFVNAARTGNLIFMSGKISKKADGTIIEGKAGIDVTIEEARDAARWAAFQQLEGLKAEIGDLNKVVRIVKVLGMVNSPAGFYDQPAIINGFSDMMIEVFGERGKHARSAVGMSALPANAVVEVEMIVEVLPD